MKISTFHVAIFLFLFFAFVAGCSDTLNPEPPKIIYPYIDEYPSWSPDGTRILYYHHGILEIYDSGHCTIDPDSAGLWMVNVDGSNPHILFKSGFIMADWSLNGDWIVFSSDATIYKAKINNDQIDTTSINQLTFTDLCYYPTWSPDGQWIAYDSNASDPKNLLFGIWKMRNDDTEKEMIKEHARMPHWSPMGDRIVHVQYMVGKANPEIFSIDTLGTNQYQLTSNGKWNRYPEYSHDGARIAFESDGEVFIMNNDGSGLHRIIGGVSPSWSPDGSRLAFIRYDRNSKNDNGTVWVVNIDGTNLRQVTHGPK